MHSKKRCIEFQGVRVLPMRTCDTVSLPSRQYKGRPFPGKVPPIHSHSCTAKNQPPATPVPAPEHSTSSTRVLLLKPSALHPSASHNVIRVLLKGSFS